jgi:hypothetical protein
MRRVTLAWRKSYSRLAALRALRKAVLKVEIPGLVTLVNEQPVAH